MSHVQPSWRETVDADPLGLARRRSDDPLPAGAKGEPRGDLVRLLFILAAIVGLGFAGGYGETTLLILLLILCIVAHEFGHYIAARTGAIKVTEFFVGFGPRLWSVRRGETEYGVKAIPLGGYCRIIGMNNLEEVDPGEEARTYRHAPLWRRLLIDVAGSSMHFLIALVVLFAMFFWTGDRNYVTQVPMSSPIAKIFTFAGAGSPAEQAGFRIGDRVQAIDGRRFSSWETASKYIKAHPGTTLDVVVTRGRATLHLHPTPVAADTVEVVGPNRLPGGRVGIVGLAVNPTVHSGFTSSISRAGGAFVAVSANSLDALGRLVSFRGISNYVHSVTDPKAAAANPNRLTTVIGLPSVLQQAGQSGLPDVLWLLAVVNISIGIFNLIPLFPLDGGRVAVGLYEGVRSIRRRGYRVDMARLLPVMYGGLALIMFFALGSMFIDLRSATS